MKRMICLILLVVMMVSLLTACGSFTCGLCGEKSSGKSYTTYNPFAARKEEIKVCEECYNSINGK